jgi:general stress protein 26
MSEWQHVFFYEDVDSGKICSEMASADVNPYCWRKACGSDTDKYFLRSRSSQVTNFFLHIKINNNMSSPKHKALIWNLIKDVRIGMLITQSGDRKESLSARPMSLVQDAYDGTLYFFASKSTSKLTELNEEKEEVCITFSDPTQQVYVSLSGHSKMTKDPDLISKYWSEGVSAWFPKGKNDPDVAIYEIKIYKGEHWNTDENKFVQLFEFTKAKLTDETPDIGEHEKFGSK